MTARTPMLKPTAWTTMPGYIVSKTAEIAPRNSPSRAA